MSFDMQMFHNLVFEAEQDAENIEQPPEGYDPNQDPSMAPQPGVDPNMAGMSGAGMTDPYGGYGMTPDENEKLKPSDVTQLSRRFELSKIYKRLLELDTVLTLVTERPLLDARNYVREAISIFKSLVFNIDLFTDKLDRIIINYYKFLDGTYKYVKEFYKAKNEQDKTDNDRKVEKQLQKISSLQAPNDLTDNLYY